MKLFAIVCAARTGSTFLRDWLDAQPSIACHGELIGPRQMRGYSRKMPPEAREPYMDLAYRRAPMRHDRPSDIERAFLNPALFKASALGLKVLYDHLLSVEGILEANWLRSRKDIAIIHLTRRDAKARYLSWLRKIGHEVETVSDDEWTRDARRIESATGYVLDLLKDGRPWLEVEYENILAFPTLEARRIYDFLEIEGVPLPFEIKTQNPPAVPTFHQEARRP